MRGLEQALRRRRETEARIEVQHAVVGEQQRRRVAAAGQRRLHRPPRQSAAAVLRQAADCAELERQDLLAVDDQPLAHRRGIGDDAAVFEQAVGEVAGRPLAPLAPAAEIGLGEHARDVLAVRWMQRGVGVVEDAQDRLL
nr:hypothetical protein [Lysobacter enzymogenes]